jgi:hypothetical protein
VDEYNVIIETDEEGNVHKYWRNFRDPEGNRIVVYDVEDIDKIDGAEAILKKVQIARTWLKDSWGVDLDELRNEVQTRQASYNINELRKLVYDIQ